MRHTLATGIGALLPALVLAATAPPPASGNGRDTASTVFHHATAPRHVDLAAPLAVPLTASSHLLTVAARIDGQGPFHLAVDSGAAGLLHLSAAVARSLALEQVGEAITGDPSGSNPRHSAVVRVASVEIGGARFEGVDAVVGDAPGPAAEDGVIGLALFSGLTVTLDYPRSELRLSREPLAAGAPHVVSFTSTRGIPQIEVSAAGVPLTVDVDTGSPALLSLPAAAAARLPLGEQRVVGRGRTATNEFEIRGADLRGDLEVAGWTAATPAVDLVDLFPVGNLGSRFLRDYAVSFDLANHRLALER